MLYDPMWDPNTWDPTPAHHLIYGDVNCKIATLVDDIDYHWAIQYLWTSNPKRGRNKVTIKDYFRRGVWHPSGYIQTVYLHVEIMKRAQPVPPSPRHVIADHRDSNTLDCRRHNLRWATHAMNSQNKFGSKPHDLIEG